jgi:hypothetical protein
MTAWSQVERNMCVIRATSCSGWMLGAMYNQHRCGACRHFKRNTYDILKRRALDRFKEENMIKITINNVETLPIPAYVMDPHVAPSTLDKVSTEISWGIAILIILAGKQEGRKWYSYYKVVQECQRKEAYIKQLLEEQDKRVANGVDIDKLTHPMHQHIEELKLALTVAQVHQKSYKTCCQSF